MWKSVCFYLICLVLDSKSSLHIKFCRAQNQEHGGWKHKLASHGNKIEERDATNAAKQDSRFAFTG